MVSSVLNILVVDQDAKQRGIVETGLKKAGYSVQSAISVDEGLKCLQQETFDIVLCDLEMPDLAGLAFVERAHEVAPGVAIVLLTTEDKHDEAIAAIRRGAYDFITKPFSSRDLVLTVRKVEEREKLRAENKALREELSQRYNFSNIIAQSKSMHDIFETVKRLTSFNTTVLITGESGTGKELLARAIHFNSPRKDGPFIAINCGAIPENLIESELFGHKKGSFTDATRDKKGLFEEAHGGTIFLDEIGELPLHLQVKILRSLQEKSIRRVGDERDIPIDARILAATHRDLEDDVMTGRFREDLFYRLNVVALHIPALRERPDDIPILVEHFLKKHNKRLGLKIKKVEAEAMQALMSYRWRGNVRELENCIERAMVLTEKATIELDVLAPHVRDGGNASPGQSSGLVFDDNNLSIKQHVRDIEIALISKALDKTGGNRTHAAKILEISHRTLLYKLKEYNLGQE